MKIFKTKHFSKWAKKNLVSDRLLLEAAAEISEGYFEANLGGSVIKKRVATKGRGKSGSVRTIVVFKDARDCFFLYGFEKKEKDNITANEEKAFKILAKELLSFTEAFIKKKIKAGSLIEVYNE